MLGLDIGGGLRQRTLATETAGTEHRDCLGVTPKRLGFFAGYFPAAVFFFEGAYFFGYAHALAQEFDNVVVNTVDAAAEIL